LLLVTKVRGTSLWQRVGTNKPFSEFGLKHIHFVFFSLKIIIFGTAKSAHISSSSWRVVDEGAMIQVSSAYIK